MFDMIAISFRDGGGKFMDLRQLRYFVAVAERGGFGAAASVLNVAQSALSRHIKQLEHEFGGSLLERGPRGVTLTESGKVLQARAHWLLGVIDDIKGQGAHRKSRTVRHGAVSGAIKPPISFMRRLRRFS
jgi:LysR family transcriptional regulator, nitrogen assimilation regulatory protein